MFGQLEQRARGQAQASGVLQSDTLPDRIRLGWVLIRMIAIVCLTKTDLINQHECKYYNDNQ